jgi:hypothetical protein
MMIDTHQRPSGISQLRRLLTVAALAVSIAGIGTASAQQASDSTDIDISVLPGTPTPIVNPPGITPTPGVSATPTAVAPAETVPPAPLSIGTVSARFALVQANTLTTRDDDAIVTIVVRDERGTAAGWTIALMAAPEIPAEQALALLENRDGTIRRVIPADGRLSDQVQGITGGHTVGIAAPPIPLLHAALGSGAGVYLQPLIFIIPNGAIPGAIFTIQLTSAP